MKRPEIWITVGLAAAAAFVLGLVVAGTIAPHLGHSETETAYRWSPDPGPVRPVDGPRAGLVDFADIVERVNPAVVNVTVVGAKLGATAGGPPLGDPFQLLPRDPRRPDDDRRRPQPERGSGSGFFIDKSGYLLTNHHVIENAERVDVGLMNSAVLRARVVGSDPVTDIALLKVERAGEYPAIPLGDSDALRVGEWVCAIGNPLHMYDHTVTVGVVSYKGRVLWNASFDDYIQTDAAINFGNSGGPLINARGEVVGINTAVSQYGQGIGFAIPINAAKDILGQLKERGRVTRGYLGVYLDDVDEVYARRLELDRPRGAVVTRVGPGSAAERAGLRRYDVILEVDGRPIESSADLVRTVSLLPPGTTVRLVLHRDGRRVEATAVLDERRVETASAADAGDEGEGTREAPSSSFDRIGLAVSAVDEAIRKRLSLEAAGGARVEDVDHLGAAWRAGIRPGDVVVEIDREPIADVAAYRSAVGAARPGDTLLFYVVRGPSHSFVAKVTVEE